MLRRLRQKGFARLYDRMQASYEEHVGPRRTALLSGVSGRVLELGPGTGINLPHLTETSRRLRWMGVEPNPFMREELTKRARGLGIEPEFCALEGNRLVAEDESVDFVISTLVLCSVADPRATLSEIKRVLAPGGRFVFLEHVAAPRGTWTRRIQNGMRPLWNFLADGCNPNRETDRFIEEAGFEAVDTLRFLVEHHALARAIAPHVSGVAVKA